MNIENRLVAGDLDLIRFLYPNYEVVSEIPLFPTRPAIYTGLLKDMDLFVAKYRELGLNFIVHTPFQSEINVDNRFTLLSIVFKKYNRYVPKYVYNMMNLLDYDTFMSLCKFFWLTGDWELKEVDYEKSFLDFIGSLNSSKRDMMTTYFNVLKDTHSYRLESSLLTFFIRARDRDYKGKSIIYNRMLNSFREYKLVKARSGIEESFKYKIDNHDLRLLNMVMCIVDQK